MPARAQRTEHNLLRIGDVFLEKYQILGLAGSGGHGCVYSAQSLFMGREVAIKVLDRARGMTDEARARGQREAIALGRLGRHTGIVEVYDAGIDPEGRLYIVMEHLEGCTLHQHLRERGPLDVRAGLRLLIALCDALEFARQAKVVHRDVKPTNIFITPDGTPKLVDFGIAKITDAPGFQTAPQVVVGTALYVSPEQIRAQPATHRSDLYALGLVAYQVFCGEHPLLLAAPDADRRDLRVIWALHLHADPPRLDTVVSAFPEYVARLVHTAMSKEPAKRYASAAEFGKRARETLARYENDYLLAQRSTRVAAMVAAGVPEGAPPAEVKEPGARARSERLVSMPGTPTPEHAVSDGSLKRSIATPPTEQFLPPTPPDSSSDPWFPSPPLARDAPGTELPGSLLPGSIAWPSLHEASVWTPPSAAREGMIRRSRGTGWRNLATSSRTVMAILLGVVGLSAGFVWLLAGPASSTHPPALRARQQGLAAPVWSAPEVVRMAPSEAEPQERLQLPERTSALPLPAVAVRRPAARAHQKPPLRVAIRPLPVQEEQPRDQGAHWAESIVPPEAPTLPHPEEGVRQDAHQPEPWLN